MPRANPTTSSPLTANPIRTATGHDPADVEDEDRESADRDDHRSVDHSLDDDRAERRGAADPLPVTEVVAADQLAEPGRQDVVGQIADQEIAKHGHRADGSDGGDEALPAGGSEQDVDRLQPDRHEQPGRDRRAQDVRGPAEVHPRQDVGQRGDRDGDAEDGPSQTADAAPHRNG